MYLERVAGAGFVETKLYFSCVWSTVCPLKPVEDGSARVIRGEGVRDRLTVGSVNASNLVPLKSPYLVSLAGQERERVRARAKERERERVRVVHGG